MKKQVFVSGYVALNIMVEDEKMTRVNLPKCQEVGQLM